MPKVKLQRRAVSLHLDCKPHTEHLLLCCEELRFVVNLCGIFITFENLVLLQAGDKVLEGLTILENCSLLKCIRDVSVDSGSDIYSFV